MSCSLAFLQSVQCKQRPKPTSSLMVISTNQTYAIILWDNAPVRPSNNYSMQLNNAMLDFVGANFLTQLTDRPTRNDNILDLTLTTNPAFSLNNGMLDFVSANFLTQLTDIPTRNDNILDLALTTNPAFSQPPGGACWSVVYLYSVFCILYLLYLLHRRTMLFKSM